MEAIKEFLVSLPPELAKELARDAEKGKWTVSEQIRDTLFRYYARKNFEELAAEARRQVKEKGLTPEDFGGPFAE